MKSLFIIGMLIIGFSAMANTTLTFGYVPQTNECSFDNKDAPELTVEKQIAFELRLELTHRVATIELSNLTHKGNSPPINGELNIASVSDNENYDTDVGYRKSESIYNVILKNTIDSYRRARDGLMCFSSVK